MENKETNADLENMSREELKAELVRLKMIKGGDTEKGIWDNEMWERMQAIEKMLKKLELSGNNDLELMTTKQLYAVVAELGKNQTSGDGWDLDKFNRLEKASHILKQRG
ncbi:MAG TPA: hypothetical protein VGA89_03005 [Patescibacteria group bacterium]